MVIIEANGTWRKGTTIPGRVLEQDLSGSKGVLMVSQASFRKSFIAGRWKRECETERDRGEVVPSPNRRHSTMKGTRRGAIRSKTAAVLNLCLLLLIILQPKPTMGEVGEQLRRQDALFKGIIDGDVVAVKSLLAQGADPNEKDDIGATPLWVAAGKGRPKIVELLLQHGAEVGRRSMGGSTALWVASQFGHLPDVKILLAHGADVNAKDDLGGTALQWAAAKGHLDVMLLLLDRHAEVDARRQSGTTALSMAAESGQVIAVRELLARGADPKISKDSHGWTPLMTVSRDGHVEIVKELLRHCEEVNDREVYFGWTALHFAARNGHVEIVKLLLLNGADGFAVDKEGKTPLKGAQEKGRREVVEILREWNRQHAE